MVQMQMITCKQIGLKSKAEGVSRLDPKADAIIWLMVPCYVGDKPSYVEDKLNMLEGWNRFVVPWCCCHRV